MAEEIHEIGIAARAIPNPALKATADEIRAIANAWQAVNRATTKAGKLRASGGGVGPAGFTDAQLKGTADGFKRIGGAVDDLGTKAKKSTKGPKDLNAELKKLVSDILPAGAASIGRFAQRFAGFGIAVGAGAAAMIGFFKAASAGLSASIEFSGDLVTVGKNANLTADEVAALGVEIDELSRQPLGQSAASLTAIAAAAGQVGVTGVPALREYTEQAALVASASDLAGDEAVKFFGRLQAVTGDLPEDVGKIGSGLVALGQNAAASESEIAAVALRVAQATANLDLGSAASLAFGATLKGIGVAAESGGSSVGRLARTIQEATLTGGEDLDKLAAIAGVTGQELTDAFAQDKAQAILLFLQGLEDQGERASIALKGVGLGSEDSLRVLPSLASASDQLAAALATVNEQYETQTAAQEEATKQAETTRAQQALLSNELESLARILGDELEPGFQDGIRGAIELAEASRPLISGISSLVGVLADVTGGVLRFAGEMLSLRPIIKGLEGDIAGIVGPSEDFADVLADVDKAIASGDLAKLGKSFADIADEAQESSAELNAARVELEAFQFALDNASNEKEAAALTDKVNEQKAAIGRLILEGRKFNEALEAIGEAEKKAKKKTGDLTDDVGGLSRKLESLAKSLTDDFADPLEVVTGKADDLRTLLKAEAIDLDTYRRALAEVGREASGVAKEITDAEDAFDGLSKVVDAAFGEFDLEKLTVQEISLAGDPGAFVEELAQGAIEAQNIATALGDAKTAEDAVAKAASDVVNQERRRLAVVKAIEDAFQSGILSEELRIEVEASLTGGAAQGGRPEGGISFGQALSDAGSQFGGQAGAIASAVGELAQAGKAFSSAVDSGATKFEAGFQAAGSVVAAIEPLFGGGPDAPTGRFGAEASRTRAAEGSAIGAVVGLAFGSPQAGAAIGGAIGGMVEVAAEHARAGIEQLGDSLDIVIQGSNAALASSTRQVGSAVKDTIEGLLDQVGGTIDISGADLSFELTGDDEIKVDAAGVITVFKSVEEAVAFIAAEALRLGEVSGVGENVAKAFEGLAADASDISSLSLAPTPEEIAETLQLADALDAFAINAGEVDKRFRTITTLTDDYSQIALKRGLAVADVFALMDKEITGLIDDITGRFSGIFGARSQLADLQQLEQDALDVNRNLVDLEADRIARMEELATRAETLASGTPLGRIGEEERIGGTAQGGGTLGGRVGVDETVFGGPQNVLNDALPLGDIAGGFGRILETFVEDDVGPLARLQVQNFLDELNEAGEGIGNGLVGLGDDVSGAVEEVGRTIGGGAGGGSPLTDGVAAFGERVDQATGMVIETIGGASEGFALAGDVVAEGVEQFVGGLNEDIQAEISRLNDALNAGELSAEEFEQQMEAIAASVEIASPHFEDINEEIRALAERPPIEPIDEQRISDAFNVGAFNAVEDLGGILERLLGSQAVAGELAVAQREKEIIRLAETLRLNQELLDSSARFSDVARGALESILGKGQQALEDLISGVIDIPAESGRGGGGGRRQARDELADSFGRLAGLADEAAPGLAAFTDDLASFLDEIKEAQRVKLDPALISDALEDFAAVAGSQAVEPVQEWLDQVRGVFQADTVLNEITTTFDAARLKLEALIAELGALGAPTDDLAADLLDLAEAQRLALQAEAPDFLAGLEKDFADFGFALDPAVVDEMARAEFELGRVRAIEALAARDALGAFDNVEDFDISEVIADLLALDFDDAEDNIRGGAEDLATSAAESFRDALDSAQGLIDKGSGFGDLTRSFLDLADDTRTTREELALLADEVVATGGSVAGLKGDLTALELGSDRVGDALAGDLVKAMQDLGADIPVEVTRALAEAQFELARVELLTALATGEASEAFARAGIDVGKLAQELKDVDFSFTGTLTDSSGGTVFIEDLWDFDLPLSAADVRALFEDAEEALGRFLDLGLSPFTAQAKSAADEIAEIAASIEGLTPLEGFDLDFAGAMRAALDDILDAALGPFEDLDVSATEIAARDLAATFADIKGAIDELGDVSTAEDLARILEAEADAFEAFFVDAADVIRGETPQELTDAFQELLNIAAQFGGDLGSIEQDWAEAMDALVDTLVDPVQDILDEFSTGTLAGLDPSQSIAQAQEALDAALADPDATTEEVASAANALLALQGQFLQGEALFNQQGDVLAALADFIANFAEGIDLETPSTLPGEFELPEFPDFPAEAFDPASFDTLSMNFDDSQEETREAFRNEVSDLRTQQSTDASDLRAKVDTLTQRVEDQNLLISRTLAAIARQQGTIETLVGQNALLIRNLEQQQS